MSNLASHIKNTPGKTLGDWAKDFGISRPYLYQLMDGARAPSLDVAKRIAAATNGSVPIATWPNIAKILDAAQSDSGASLPSRIEAAE